MTSGGSGNRMASSYLRQPTLVKASAQHEIKPNAKLIIPKTPKVYLPPRDDAAEFDDSGPDLRYDIKNTIKSRDANSGVRNPVIPHGLHPMAGVGWGWWIGLSKARRTVFLLFFVF